MSICQVSRIDDSYCISKDANKYNIAGKSSKKKEKNKNPLGKVKNLQTVMKTELLKIALNEALRLLEEFVKLEKSLFSYKRAALLIYEEVLKKSEDAIEEFDKSHAHIFNAIPMRAHQFYRGLHGFFEFASSESFFLVGKQTHGEEADNRDALTILEENHKKWKGIIDDYTNILETINRSEKEDQSVLLKKAKKVQSEISRVIIITKTVKYKNFFGKKKQFITDFREMPGIAQNVLNSYEMWLVLYGKLKPPHPKFHQEVVKFRDEIFGSYKLIQKLQKFYQRDNTTGEYFQRLEQLPEVWFNVLRVIKHKAKQLEILIKENNGDASKGNDDNENQRKTMEYKSKHDFYYLLVKKVKNKLKKWKDKVERYNIKYRSEQEKLDDKKVSFEIEMDGSIRENDENVITYIIVRTWGANNGDPENIAFKDALTITWNNEQIFKRQIQLDMEKLDKKIEKEKIKGLKLLNLKLAPMNGEQPDELDIFYAQLYNLIPIKTPKFTDVLEGMRMRIKTEEMERIEQERREIELSEEQEDNTNQDEEI